MFLLSFLVYQEQIMAGVLHQHYYWKLEAFDIEYSYQIWGSWEVLLLSFLFKQRSITKLWTLEIILPGITFWLFFYSNPEHPFAAGVTLKKLSAVTVDDKGNETFISEGALDHIRKVVS